MNRLWTLIVAAGLLVTATAPTCGNKPPCVTWTYPTPGSSMMRTSITLKAFATDDGDVDNFIFRVDGVYQQGTHATGPGQHECVWDASQATAGNHTLEADATDDNNKHGADTISVYLH
jgi:hypothetical protein